VTWTLATSRRGLTWTKKDGTCLNEADGGIVFSARGAIPNEWDFGADYSGKDSYMQTVIYDPRPGCYQISGFVAEGICGKDEAPTQDWSNGKYTRRVCSPNKQQLAGLRAAFEQMVAGFTFEQCLANLLASSISSDCASLTGPQGPAKYRVEKLLQDRRDLLPDCCVTQLEMRWNETCNCKDNERDASTKGDVSYFCRDFCCCETAIQQISPERPIVERFKERNQIFNDFKSMQAQLRLTVQEECCDATFFDQCRTRQHCTDAASDSGYVENTAVYPMCCDYCYDIYNTRCSFMSDPLYVDGVETVPATKISMKSEGTNYKLKLEELCRVKLKCRDQMPCSFSGAARGAAMTHLYLLMALGASLATRNLLSDVFR